MLAFYIFQGHRRVPLTAYADPVVFANIGGLPVGGVVVAAECIR